MENCIFCKIAAKQAPAKIVWENEDAVAFYDLHPAAKVHVLLIPKQHIASLLDLTDSHEHIMGKVVCAIAKVAKALNLEHFKLDCHTGAASGQSVFHIHFHILQH